MLKQNKASLISPRLLKLLSVMEVDSYLPWELTDSAKYPKVHPVQRAVHNHGDYYKKRFHTFRFRNRLYIIRIE